MSLSKNTSLTLKDAIDWYKNLSSERQASIIIDFFKDASKLNAEEREKLQLIVLDVSSSLASEPKENIVLKLVSFGLDDTLSRIIVEKTGKIQPDPAFCAQALIDLKDETFKQLVTYVVTRLFLDNSKFRVEFISKELGINTNVVQSALYLLRDSIVWPYLLGTIGMESIKKAFLDDFKYPQTKVDILTTILEENKSEVRFALMFGMLRDLNVGLVKVTQSLTDVSNALKDLLQMAKGKSPTYSS